MGLGIVVQASCLPLWCRHLACPCGAGILPALWCRHLACLVVQASCLRGMQAGSLHHNPRDTHSPPIETAPPFQKGPSPPLRRGLPCHPWPVPRSRLSSWHPATNLAACLVPALGFMKGSYTRTLSSLNTYYGEDYSRFHSGWPSSDFGSFSNLAARRCHQKVGVQSYGGHRLGHQ